MWPFYSPSGWCKFYNSLGGEVLAGSLFYAVLLYIAALVARCLRGAFMWPFYSPSIFYNGLGGEVFAESLLYAILTRGHS